MKTKSRFDEAAAQWDQNPERVELARAVGAAIIDRVQPQPGWRALDYGAGTGLLTLRLQPHLGWVVALDTSQQMLDMLARKLVQAGITNVETRLWNLESRPYPEHDIDMVVSSMTLHHIRDIPLLFTRLREVLKPGGGIALADLDAEDGSFHGSAEDVFHHGFDRARITEWLEEAGFCGVSVQDAHGITKPTAAGESRSYGVFLATGKRAGQ